METKIENGHIYDNRVYVYANRAYIYTNRVYVHVNSTGSHLEMGRGGLPAKPHEAFGGEEGCQTKNFRRQNLIP